MKRDGRQSEDVCSYNRIFAVHFVDDVKYSDEMSVLVEEIADDIRDFNKKVVKSSKSDHGLAKIDASGSKSPQPKSGPRGSLGGRKKCVFYLSSIYPYGATNNVSLLHGPPPLSIWG